MGGQGVDDRQENRIDANLKQVARTMLIDLPEDIVLQSWW